MGVPRELVSLNRALALERLEGDEGLLAEIAALFLSDYRNLLDEVRNAVVRQDPEALHRAAHALKGSVANFCAQQVFDSAYRLERMGREGDLSGAGQALADLEQQLQRLEPELASLATGGLTRSQQAG